MPRALVLGGGMVGSVLAADLARDPDVTVTLADRSPEALERARLRAPALAAVQADLSEPARVRELAAGHDVVCGALASHLGFAALEAVIDAATPCVDISFMPEDARRADRRARERGVTAIVDCGVAPGTSNLLAAWGAARLQHCERVEILVGGLPRERRWPWEYKAAFAPADVIEEYTRPARLVEHGETVVREPLTGVEHVCFDGVGTLEAFLTDGLRTLLDTLPVPHMVEKTLRYPGHAERMAALRDAGFFSTEPIEVAGVRVVPREVTSALLFPRWAYEEGEEDLTVMRVTATGTEGGRGVRHRWDLLAGYDRRSGTTGMARTTAAPAAVVARWILSGELRMPGVHAPEALAREDLPQRMLAALAERDIHYHHRVESV